MTIDQIIERLSDQYPDSEHQMTVVMFAEWLQKNASEPKPACNTCADQGEIYVGPGIAQYGAETQPDPIYRACPDCTRPAPAGVVQFDMRRFSATTQEADPMYEDAEGEWVKFEDVISRLNGAPK